MFEAILILVAHAAVVSVALILGWAIEHLHHALADPHAVPTFADRAIDLGIHFAERILGVGLIIVGTFNALWTFVRRRRE